MAAPVYKYSLFHPPDVHVNTHKNAHNPADFLSLTLMGDEDTKQKEKKQTLRGVCD